jgi:hypothetical protein
VCYNPLMNRRGFMAAIAAGAVVTAEGLWMPGSKLISIPKARPFPHGWIITQESIGDSYYQETSEYRKTIFMMQDRFEQMYYQYPVT